MTVDQRALIVVVFTDGACSHRLHHFVRLWLI